MSKQEPNVENSGCDDGLIPFKEKLSYAMGNLPGGIYSGIMGQINTFYYLFMALNWKWIVIGQIIYAIWNAINDPIFGVLQDRTKTKNGRYIPWIKWSAPLMFISFLLVFFPPTVLRDVGNSSDMFSEKQILLFIYYLATQLFYDTAYTVIYIAWVALLPQMTLNEGERTKTAFLATITALIGMVASTVAIGNLIGATEETIKVFKIIVACLSVISFIPWIFVVKYVKERMEYIPEQEFSFKESFNAVVKNPAGRIYMYNEGLVQGIFFFLMTAITFALYWLVGLGNEPLAAATGWSDMKAILVMVPAIIGFILGVIIQIKLTEKYTLKATLQFSLTTEAIGFLLAFIGFIPPMAYTETPLISNNIWLASIGLFIALMGLPGYFLYQNPMRADVIDYDELTTGERRESIYAGIACIFGKPMQSVGMATVPAILAAFGLVAADTSDPTAEITAITMGYPNAYLGVAIACFLIPGILALIGTFVWRKYPLTKEIVLDMREKLTILHEQKRCDRLNQDGSSKFSKTKEKKEG